MCPAARGFGPLASNFSQESWRISRKNCAVQGAKDPPVVHVDIFQTSPKHHLIVLFEYVFTFSKKWYNRVKKVKVMLHNEARKLIVEAYDKGVSVK